MKLKNKKEKINGIRIISFFILGFSIVMVMAYGIFIGWKPSHYAEDWGNFGSYFASITGLLAFFGVLYTASLSEKRADEEKIRRKKAEEYTKIIEGQNKEEWNKREERDLFFKLLELHQAKLNLIVYLDDDNRKTICSGVEAIETYVCIVNIFLNNYSLDSVINKKDVDDLLNCSIHSPSFYDQNIYHRGHEYINDSSSLYTKEMWNCVKDKIKKALVIPNFYVNEKIRINNDTYKYFPGVYEYFKIEINEADLYAAMKYIGDVMAIKYGQIFGQYFRTMYYVLKTCNEFKYNKEYYMRLYRAQLSRSEIVLCLLNALSEKSSPKLVKLLNDNNILDDLYYKDLVPIKYYKRYSGKELQLVKALFDLYLKEHIEL